jgi:hypothetical protein
VADRGGEARVTHADAIHCLRNADLPEVRPHRSGASRAELGRVDAEERAVRCDELPHGARHERFIHLAPLPERQPIAGAVAGDEREGSGEAGSRPAARVDVDAERRGSRGLSASPEELLPRRMAGKLDEHVVQEDVRAADVELGAEESFLLERRARVPRCGGPRGSGGDADGGDEAEGKEQTDRHPACEGGMRHEVLHVCEGRSRVLEHSSPRNGGRFTHSGKISAAP